jgi:hypothetical protein
MGHGGKELARAICHPDSADAFRELAKAGFDSEAWRKAIATLSRLGGNAIAKPAAKTSVPARAAVPDDERAARAAGGSVGAVGAAKLGRAAEAARKEIAAATKPIMGLADEQVAAALRLAARE